MWDFHPLGNNIEFHPPIQRNPNDSDLSGHDQRFVGLLFDGLLFESNQIKALHLMAQMICLNGYFHYLI